MHRVDTFEPGKPFACYVSLNLELVAMPCKYCGSVNQAKFTGEVAIHLVELENIDKPIVWVFPELVVCLDCGNAEFAVAEAELRELAKIDIA
jgi:hypothetical protein